MNYTLNKAEMFFDLADEQAIIIDTMQGFYYAVNKLGSLLLDAVLTGGTLESAEKALQKLGAPEDIGTRIKGFFEQLHEYRIVILGEGTNEITLSEDAVSEGFTLEINMYDDMADLLTADPIHDVDETFGWPEKKETLD